MANYNNKLLPYWTEGVIFKSTYDYYSQKLPHTIINYPKRPYLKYYARPCTSTILIILKVLNNFVTNLIYLTL